LADAEIPQLSADRRFARHTTQLCNWPLLPFRPPVSAPSFCIPNFFLSAAVGLCALTAIIQLFRGQKKIGNFFVDMWRVVVYIFLPVAFLLSLVFAQQGMPMTYRSSYQVSTLDPAAMGTTDSVARGTGGVISIWLHVSFLLRCSVPAAHYLPLFQWLRGNQMIYLLSHMCGITPRFRGGPRHTGGYLQRLGGLCAICRYPADFPIWMIQICEIIKLRITELGKLRLTLRYPVCRACSTAWR
jgi:hypothetical protein